MTRKPAYLPKRTRRRKIRFKVLIPFFVLCALLIYSPFAMYQTFFKKPAIDTAYTICGLSSKKTKALLLGVSVEEGFYEVKDHVFYGEHLGLYASTYVKGSEDALLNKSITFKNMCNEETYVYMMSSELDKKIPLYELTPGYYEVFVSSLMKNERIYMSEEMNDEFYTITRGGVNHKISMVANPKMYYAEDETFLLEKPYLFVEVKEDVLPLDYYDIILDSGHNTYDEGPILERGHGANGLVEAAENLKASEVLKQELEAAGLKVKMVREGDEVINTYNVGGRIEMVYKHHAKYYISSHLNAINDKRVRGSEVFYSSFTSSTLAESVLNAITSKTDMVASGNIGKGNRIPSVLPTSLYLGFDDLMMIREPGGRALGAGQISKKAQSENYPFIEGTNYGAQAILIEYIYMSNTADAALWKAKYQEYAKAAASGIIEYLHLDINASVDGETKKN